MENPEHLELNQEIQDEINQIIDHVLEGIEIETANQHTCLQCHLPLEQTTPQLETLCHHKFHTQCFMIETEHRFSCPFCGTCLLGPDHDNLHRVEEERTIHRRREKVEKVFLENETVGSDYKLLKKELNKLSSSFTKAEKTIKSKKREFQNEIKFFHDEIVKRKKESIKTIRNSVEFKEFQKQRRKTDRIVTEFENAYDLTMKDLARVPALKLKNTWRYRRALLYSLSYSRRFRVRI